MYNDSCTYFIKFPLSILSRINSLNLLNISRGRPLNRNQWYRCLTLFRTFYEISLWINTPEQPVTHVSVYLYRTAEWKSIKGIQSNCKIKMLSQFLRLENNGVTFPALLFTVDFWSLGVSDPLFLCWLWNHIIEGDKHCLVCHRTEKFNHVYFGL